MWQEAGSKPVKEIKNEVLDVPSPENNPRYKSLVTELARFHKDLIELEKAEKLRDSVNSPGIISDYLAKLRLGCSQLYEFLNRYIDVHSDLTRELATKRQSIFETALKAGKTPSMSSTLASELTKVDSASVKIVENRIQQIKNTYEEYNGICIMLQSKMREFNTERIVG